MPGPFEEIIKRHRSPQEGQGARERLADLIGEMLTPQDDELSRDRERCEGSLYEFAKAAWHILEPHEFVPGWHIQCICEHLEAVTRGEIRNLVLNLPPRHGKSVFVSVFWFCWAWTLEPSSRWVFTSYSDGLASRDGLKCLDVLKSPWFQERWGWKFQLRAGQKAMSKFSNNKNGFRLSTSVQGRALGEGGDYIIADDANKASEIYSDTLRERVNRWWSETMSTRSGTSPKTVRKVVVQQRLHERDLSGYLMASDLGYECLVLPCRYDPKRYFLPTPEQPLPEKKMRDMIIPTSLQRQRPELMDPRKEEGELLWPDRFDQEAVDALARELQAVGTAGQLDQRPSPADGDVFKRGNMRYTVKESVPWKADASKLVSCYTLVPRGRDHPIHIPVSWCRHYICADTALKANAKAKYTAVGLFASAPVYRNEVIVARYLLILDFQRDKLGVPDQFPYLNAYWDAHPEAVFLAVEPKASGIGLIQQSVAAGRPYKTLKVDGDKVKRAGPACELYESGLVYHKEDMPLRVEFEDEMLSFPNGQYNDMCDCLAHGAILFNHERILTAAGQEYPTAYPQAADLPDRTVGKFTISGVEIDLEDEPGDGNDRPEWWRK